MSLIMLLDIVIFICSILLNFTDISQTANENLYVSKSTSTWNEMENVCSVGSPSFQFKSDGNVVSFDNITGIDHNGVWVGYFEIMEHFSYIRCLKKDQVSFNSYGNLSATELLGSPGRCFRRCGYGIYFGLMNSECFCFKRDPIQFNTSQSASNCNSTCQHYQGVACGGAGSLSVYKFNPNVRKNLYGQDSKIDQANMFCLKVNSETTLYSWTNCTISLAVVCDFSGKKVSISNPPTLMTWAAGADRCFQENASLIPISDNLSLKFKSQIGIWTRIVRSPVVYNFGYFNTLMKKADYKSSLIRYGLVTRKKNQYIMTFTDRRSHRNVLCLIDYNETSLVKIEVGISVATVIPIAVVVAILLLKKRRKLQEKKIEEKLRRNISDGNCPVSTLNTSPTHSKRLNSTANYVDIDIELKKEDHHEEIRGKTTSHSAQVHNYFVLQKLNNDYESKDMAGIISGSVPSHVALQKNRREDTAKKKEDETFAVFDFDISETEKNENNYKKSYKDQGNTYDHICISGHNVSWIADKTYSSISKVKIKCTEGQHDVKSEISNLG